MVLDCFVLSDDAPLDVAAGPAAVERWQPPSHLGRLRPALVLLSGEVATTPPIRIAPHTTLHAEFTRGLPEISSDGMTLTIHALRAGQRHHLATLSLVNEDATEPHQLTMSLGHLADADARIVIEAGPGPGNDPMADWASILTLCIGPAGDIGLLKARSFRKTRHAYETAHFAAVYDHILFAERDRLAQGDAPAADLPQGPADPDKPYPGEHVYSYAARLLAQRLPGTSPDFAGRLTSMSMSLGRPVRMASLFAGTAQVEAAIIRTAKVEVDITLVDINEGLLQRACKYMPDYVKTSMLIQDVNALSLEPDQYDIIVCVSGIHHAVELERIWISARNGLRQGGELWLIGEQVGPNGNRLAPDDLAAANKAFQTLPEKYRRNAQTGTVDDEIPNKDFSEATYEGIRSEDIVPTLNRFFTPVTVYSRNCFLWRLLNQTYSENYDMAKPDDVALVESLVEAELAHLKGGGKPTELFAVYRPLI